MSTSVKACALGAWRLRHAKLTQAEAADRAGIPLNHASTIETNPSRATVGALGSYVQACGGKLECWLEVGGVRRLLVLLAVLVGCGGVVDDPLEPPGGYCETRRCELEVTTFAPTPGLAADTESILARLRKVTGRDDLRIDPAGVPIRYVDAIVGADASGECGQTEIASWNNGAEPSPIRFTQEIRIDPAPPEGCPRPYVALMHEMIHALAPHAEHVPAPSVFANGFNWTDLDKSEHFDEAASTALCGEFACAAFEPEE